LEFRCFVDRCGASGYAAIMFSDDVKWIPRPQDVVLMNTQQLRDTGYRDVVDVIYILGHSEI